MQTQTIYSPARRDKNIIQPSILLEFFILLSLFVFTNLLTDNMSENEVGKLMIAKQFVSPQWLPNDWYLNEPQTYQALFQIIFGKTISMWGFFATSVLGRILTYSLISLGLVFIGREIRLRFSLLFASTIIFLGLGQSMPIAGEWMIGGFETKGFAYGFVLLAMWLSMKKKYLWTAPVLGLATSFHVLVGGYATITILMWVLWEKIKHKNTFDWQFGNIFLASLLYLLTSLFVLIPLFFNLNDPAEVSNTTLLEATYIYTFLRNPHHLDPFTWQKIRFLIIGLHLFGVFYCWRFFTNSLLISEQNSKDKQIATEQRVALAELTAFSLIPFFLGFLVAPFDTQGVFLQYYPFRLGSLMLALDTILLLACLLQVTQKEVKFTIENFIRSKRIALFICFFVLGLICLFPVKNFTQELLALRQFPLGVEDLSAESLNAFTWIKTNTPKDSVIISSPGQFVGFNWLTDRATIVKFKLVPSTEPYIIEWYKRLNNLSGHPESWRWNKTGFAMVDQLDQDYRKLTKTQVKALMQKYRSNYFFTDKTHQLDLAIAYENAEYRLYEDHQNLLQ
ncbi:MAG: YfhO family protein [Limnothrix sp. RL_2_0]|nr:YfhO family protein [Limnothrix sp. RL_2_0]